MMVIRPVRMTDLDDIVELAGKTGSGLTTLPNNREHLHNKIQNSLQAFSKPADSSPGDECYLFVLEDTVANKVVGTSGVVAAVGTQQPFYTYKLNTVVHYSISMDIYRKLNFLTLTNDFTGASEICTLFLSPDYRGGGNGLLLSKSRFLFMAQHATRFGDKVCAEMRGVSDDKGNSPFWESVGRHFFGVDFAVADKENGEGNNQFIAELMPHHPVYVPMLSQAAQDVIGQVHEQTKPAIQMLKAEGFRYTGYVDIFDGGPTIEVPMNDVKSIRESQLVTVEIGEIDPANAVSVLISNTKLEDYRACLSKISAPVERKITISDACAKALEIGSGERVRIRFY